MLTLRFKTRVVPRFAMILPAVSLLVLTAHIDGRRPQFKVQAVPPAYGETGALPTLKQILERHIEAVGGREAIEKLKTRVMKGRLVSDLPCWKPPIYTIDSLEIYAKTPGRHLVVWRTAQGTSKEGFDGRAGWKQTSDGFTSEADLGRSYFACLVEPQNALRMSDYFPDMTVRSVEMLGERAVYVVDTDPRESRALYFDCETGLLVQMGYFDELRDYREVDGVKIPFRVTISRKGGSSTYIFETVRHNVPIDDSRFVRPR